MLNVKEFFGTSGLTSTSANHIANMAKEYYNKLEREIRSIKGFSQEVTVIGTANSMLTQQGSTDTDLLCIPEKLRKIAECKALVAYLREAIKEKDKVAKAIQQYQDVEARKQVVRPSYPDTMDEEDVKRTWSIGQLNKYFALEAKCAAFGQYIHSNGWFNNFRDNYHDTLGESMTVSGSGRDTIVKKNIPTVSEEAVDKLFFELQEEYRNAQAEFNGLQHLIEETIKKSKLEADNAYSKALTEYDAKMDEIVKAEIEFKNSRWEVLEKMKIVLPDKLKPIYDEIQNLSK